MLKQVEMCSARFVDGQTARPPTKALEDKTLQPVLIRWHLTCALGPRDPQVACCPGSPVPSDDVIGMHPLVIHVLRKRSHWKNSQKSPRLSFLSGDQKQEGSRVGLGLVYLCVPYFSPEEEDRCQARAARWLWEYLSA